MLHPVFIVTVGVILAGVPAPAFLAVRRCVHGHHRLADQIIQLQTFHQIGIPDQRAVGDADIGHHRPNLVDQLLPLFQHFTGAEHGAVALHGALHLVADQGGRGAARGMAHGIETRHHRIVHGFPQIGMGGARRYRFGQAQAGGAAKHHQIDQRVGAQAIGAMHRDTGRLAHRHQAGHNRIRVAVL